MQSLRSADGGQPPAPAPRRPAAKPQLSEGFVAVGVVLTSFGLRGDIKVEPLTDFPSRFDVGATLWLGGEARRVERSRWQRRIVYVKLSGIDTPEAIAALRGWYLELPEEERATLAPGEYFLSDIIGLAVETVEGAPLGHVVEFLPTGANDVLVVRGERGEALIPMIEDVVREVDLAGGRLLVEPIEGLIPEPRAPREPRRPPAHRWRGRRG
jgi:16S rRNA processing protein RimM